GRDEKFRELLHTPCDNTYLLFQFSRRPLFRSLLVTTKRASRNFQKITHSRMPVLTYERDGSVIKDGHNHGAARMMNDLADVSLVTLAHGVSRNVEDAPAIDFPRLKNLRGFSVRCVHKISREKILSRSLSFWRERDK